MSTRTAKGGRGEPNVSGSGKKAGKPGARPQSGGKGRKPPTVKVGKDRNWGPIILFVVVGVVAAAIIGWTFVAAQDAGKPWEERAAEIDGIANYRETNPEYVQPLEGMASHEAGDLTYLITPPVGSTHNGIWQNCQGTVYDAPIADEHAVHSMEHGAVWITYQPDLPADQVAELADRIEGTDYTLMSPYEGLDSPISLQAWGYQLKVDDAGDSRIDDFIRALRLNAAIESDATCSGGVTATGTTPQGQ